MNNYVQCCLTLPNKRASRDISGCLENAIDTSGVRSRSADYLSIGTRADELGDMLLFCFTGTLVWQKAS